MGQTQAPFPIRSLQVDGGSEFRDEFEQACRDLGIPLYVLPPKNPNTTAVWSAPTAPVSLIWAEPGQGVDFRNILYILKDIR